uniref:Ubiquitin associated protein 2 n=1 Tax=Anolis carolinensis TaxID=28377 RepID=H9GJF8_ANOCA
MLALCLGSNAYLSCGFPLITDFLFCTYIVLYILYMMTSVGSERTRGTRDKAQVPPTQPTQPQKPVVQATAEQIRLAQMIYDKNDADFEDKVKQLMEVTGKNQDDCIVALHDCNGDVNRAINILLEGNSDTTSWETVGGKKKSLGKESSENKENREKRGDREVSRGRGSSSRRGRGGSRGREFRVEENGVDSSQGDRPSDRGKRGRGRGKRSLNSVVSVMTFNPADYTESSATDGFGAKQESWESGQTDGHDGTGAWKNSIEEWTAEDWNEDLSETKVFTASSVPAENHVAPGQSIDLVTLLQKPGASSQETEGSSFETSQQQGFGQALVFTNSQHNSQMALGASNTSAVNSYSPQSLSSVLCSGFGELGASKPSNSTGSQILEQLKSPGLSQFTLQGSLSANSPVSTTTTSSWDIKPSISQSSILSQFDFKSQPEPSPVLSQLTQRQQQQQQLASPAPPPGLESFAPQKARASSPADGSISVSKMLHLPSLSAESQATPAHQAQQKQIKPLKRRIPPVSKHAVGFQIPSSAVEMPGSTDVSGLNVQFGALEFGLEASLSEFGSASSYENNSQAPNNILYTNDPLNTSLPMSNTVQEPTYTTPAITSASLSCSSQSTSPVTTASSYDQASVHSRITYQSSVPPTEPTTAVVTVSRLHKVLSTPSSVPASKTETSPPSLAAKGSSLPSTTAAPALLLPSAPPHTAPLPSLPQSNDLANSSLSQLSRYSRRSYGANMHTSVENSTVLPSPSTFSVASTLAAATSSVSTMTSSMASTTNSLGLNAASVSLPAAPTSRATPLVSSGSCPLLPPKIALMFVSPPLLSFFKQIYGYDDLQMLQSRLPMDYYGITFPAPATLTGREGSLANNPYSGDVTKFGRGDSASPAPATTLAQQQAQQNQAQSHHSAQQPFLNPTLPPGYSYTGLPYYAGVPGVPSAFQYGPTMFVPPASAKQHSVGLNAASTPFQQASGYGQHSYGAGYEELTQGTAAGDYTKGGYVGASQAQNKSTGSGPGKGVSVTSSNTGVPDISGSVYNKTQAFDKQGFHAGTPPPFSLPSALGSTGPLNPGTAPGYAPAPFLHILPAHQQPHSQMLHHHLQQDGQVSLQSGE